MKNPKSEIRNPKEIRGPKSERRRRGLAAIRDLRSSIRNLQLLFAAALAFATAPSVRAQSFALDWFSIDGGGGTSSGGGYTVSGTMGQADAGTLSGGEFTVVGGFWSAVVTVPAPGTPTLSVFQHGGVVKFAWPKPADGWVLESTPALSGPTLKWTQVTQAYQDDGINLYVTFDAPTGSAFFRLRKP